MKAIQKVSSIAVVGLAVFLLLTTAADSQGRMRRGGRRQGDVPGVQVTPEQTQQIAAIRQQTQDRVRNIRIDPNLTQQEKAERIAEARRQGHEEVLNALTPEQRQRFHEWWAACPRAGAGPVGGPGAGPGRMGPRGGGPPPDIAQGSVPGVQLAQEQMQQVARIRQETRSKVRSVRTDPDLSQQEKAERIAGAQREGHERVLSVLTPEQREQFETWWRSRPRAGAGPRGRP